MDEFQTILNKFSNLENKFSDVVKKLKEIQEIKAPPKPTQAGPDFLTKKEAARLIHVCTATLDAHARKGKILRHYVGKRVLYDREAVLALAKLGTEDNTH